MVTFILNNEQISTGKAAGSSLLDFMRYDKGLTGTKTGCREGDCGACTVLVGTSDGGRVTYKSAVSCLMPLGNAHGKHIVTIEGINTGHLSHIQNAMVDRGAIQCGFCTPGIVMSFAAESLSREKTTRESAIASVSGNICRCTGYKSIERAAEDITGALADKNMDEPVRWLVERQQLPGYFLTIPERLAAIPEQTEAIEERTTAIPEQAKTMADSLPTISGPPASAEHGVRIAGGTDLMVQKADFLAESDIVSFSDRKELKGIEVRDGRCIIGASVTISEAGKSETLKNYLPEIGSVIRLIASEPVRNMATMAGNIVNASPIGDMSIMLLALNADVTIKGPGKSRAIPLRTLFRGYRKLDLGADEFIRSFSFEYHPVPPLFSFEKVSRRTHLDIASVNSAIQLRMAGDFITECHLSAGGVSPVPLYLERTCSFLSGKPVSANILLQANEIMQEEIFPISDARGSAEYKRLLLRQLLLAHFLKLFPERINLTADQL
ncbi:2Fe-2S iron-sulfur cluster binding domain-containing protein [bacterium]|nr:2Fe-2S iron-sulfur cluster binding domain-containing protein [bacterium]